MHDLNKIIMAHGGGGELTKTLIETHIVSRFGNAALNPLMDSAILDRPDGRICMTTDSFVVHPIEFPGGDIGKLAVCGTVNDLAVMGAKPLALSLGLIIEEGLELATLDRILDSIALAAEEAGVNIVTGDTKVIERRSGDGIFINTAGIGVLSDTAGPDTGSIVPGDVIIVNGTLADHGLAVMSAREGLTFETDLVTDAAPLNGLIDTITSCGATIKFMRDPTRSGLAGVAADLTEDTGLSIELHESHIPMSITARHTADTLGLDPLLVANEGKVIIVCPQADADAVINACKSHKYGKDAAVIGTFCDRSPALVELISRIGGRRIVQRPYGEDLPRIC